MSVIEDFATSEHQHPAKYQTLLDDGVTCELCPHFCILKEGQTGICRTRTNKGHKLWSMSYGKPVAVHVDPIEKKPLNHFLPSSHSFSLGTAGCNLGCLNCQNWEISKKSPSELNHLQLSPLDVASMAKAHQCASISYTYTDPVVFYEYMADIALLARQEGIANVMVSAGYINPLPLKEIAPLIDAANIDLKCFDDRVYKTLNKATLRPVLETLLILKQYNVWLEITNLVIPGYTDDMATIEKMCRWLVNNGFSNTPLHFSRFSPLYQLSHLQPTPVKTLETAAKLAQDVSMQHVYLGNVPNHPMQHTYCPQCGSKIIERTGYTSRNSIKNGNCPHCNTPIEGVWQLPRPSTDKA